MHGIIALSPDGDLIVKIPQQVLLELNEPILPGVIGIGHLQRRPKIGPVLSLLNKRCHLSPLSPIIALNDGFFGFPAKILESDPIAEILKTPITLIRLMEESIPRQLGLRDILLRDAPRFGFEHQKIKRSQYIYSGGKKLYLAELITDGKRTYVIIGDVKNNTVYYGLGYKNNKPVAQIFVANCQDIEKVEGILQENLDLDSLKLREISLTAFMKKMSS